MSYIVVDVEADGEYPGDYSMVCFGACVVEPSLSKIFYSGVPPISDKYKPEALGISGFSREDHLSFGTLEKPELPFDKFIEHEMKCFVKWIEENSVGKPIFVSDNLAFDWMWINYYLHKYAGENPFGYSGRRIGDLWCGFNNDMFLRWKWMRDTKHTHDPVDDAKGNAEAMLKMKEKGLNIKLI